MGTVTARTFYDAVDPQLVVYVADDLFATERIIDEQNSMTKVDYFQSFCENSD